MRKISIYRGFMLPLKNIRVVKIKRSCVTNPKRVNYFFTAHYGLSTDSKRVCFVFESPAFVSATYPETDATSHLLHTCLDPSSFSPAPPPRVWSRGADGGWPETGVGHYAIPRFGVFHEPARRQRLQRWCVRIPDRP